MTDAQVAHNAAELAARDALLNLEAKDVGDYSAAMWQCGDRIESEGLKLVQLGQGLKAASHAVQRLLDDPSTAQGRIYAIV